MLPALPRGAACENCRMANAGRRLLSGIGIVLACAVAWFIMGIFVFALVAGDYLNPQDRPPGWAQALQRTLAGAWLLSPIAAIVVVVAVQVRRRRRVPLDPPGA